MKSCAIIPQVKNKKGEIIDSRLFKDLLSFTNNNRSQTNRMYYITKNPEFQSDYSDVLSYDDAGEVTMKSLLKLDLSSFLEESSIIEKVSKDYGFYKDGKPVVKDDTTENFNSSVEQAINFNNSSEYREEYVAIVERTPERGIFVSIKKVTPEDQVTAQKMAAAFNLNKKIRDFLEKNGISVGALNSLDLSLGRTGVTDFSKAFNEAEGLVELIRIAKGSKGERVLPEEFSHFIIESMANEPTVARLLNLMSDRKLAEEVLGESYSSYETLTDSSLAHEAAARLLLDSIYESENLPSDVWDRLLSRVKDRFKDKFSKMDENQLLKNIAEAKDATMQLVSSLPLQKISIPINGRQLSHIDERLDKVQKLLQRLQEQEIRRYHVFKTRSSKADSGFQASQAEFINILEGHIMSGKFFEGIVFYLKEASDVLKSTKDLFERLNDPSISFTERAQYLRSIENYVGNYKSTLSDIRHTLNEGTLDDEALGAEIKALVRSVDETLDRASSTLDKLVFQHFNDFLQSYFPEDGITINIHGSNQHISREELTKLLEYTENDPSFFNIWLDSAAESTDIVIKLTDAIIKKHKEKARNQVLDFKKRLHAAAKKLRDAGITNEDFMFEVDENGNYTHDYVSEIQWAKFRKARKDMYKMLDEKYGKNPEGDMLEQKNMERSKWYKENTTENGLPNSKYENPNFLTGAKLEYYNEFMRLRKELLDILPPNLFRDSGRMDDPMRAIQVRKDFIDRLSNSPTDNWWSEIKTSFGDMFFRREDETEFGIRVAPQDFKGKELMSLPIFFTGKLDKASDLSHDTVSTMIMFADMAFNYSNMSSIVDSLEVGRSVMIEQRGASKMRGKKPVVSVIKEFGKTVTQKLNKETTNFAEAYNNLLDTQLYGRYLKDEGSIGNTKIDIQKTASFWNRLSSLNQLALSGLAAMAAVAQDISNVNLEAVAGEFFTMGDLAKADRTYFKHLPALLGEMGNDIKTSKLALFLEKFDILHDYENEVRELSFGKNKFKKAMSTNSLYFMLRMGSHWGETRTAIAQAMNMKLYDSSGNKYNLWDILEIEYTDPAHPDYGASLKIKKKDLKKEDGTLLTDEDLEKFKNKCMALNQRLYGIYNQADKNALQRIAIGKMAFLYRNWLVPAINRRFAKASYNMMLDSETEGYYYTLGKFLWNCAKDLKDLKFTAVAYMNEMTPTEKANIKRAVTELTTLLVLTLANSLLLADWDDKDNPWVQRTAAYLSRRLQTEIGALAPTTSIFSEFFKIVKSPMAGMEPAEGTLDLISNLVNPLDWGLDIDAFGVEAEDRLIQSGKYKGRSNLYRSFMRSPFVPMKATVERMINPEESMSFFNQ